MRRSSRLQVLVAALGMLWASASLAQDPEIAVAKTLSQQGFDLYREGRYAEAEQLYRRSLEIREKVLGPEHPATAEGLSKLGLLYDTQGRYADAERLFRRSLEIREKALGPEHSDVALSLNNLAGLYLDQGRLNDAKTLFRRSLEIQERTNGLEHPSVATGLNNLAVVSRQQGRYAETEELYRRSLEIREKSLGPKHPEVAQSLNNLALLTLALGRSVEAEALFRRSLTILDETLGTNHPDVASVLFNLSLTLVGQRRYADARPLIDRGLAIREAVFGSAHPDVAEALNLLALTVASLGQFDVALVLSRRAVDILNSRFSPNSDRRTTTGILSEQRNRRAIYLINVGLIQKVSEAGAESESFRIAQLGQASETAQALAQMASRFAVGADPLATTVRERQDLADRWLRLDAAVVEASGRPPEQRDAAADAALRVQLRDAGARLDALDARIAREFPGYGELSNPAPLDMTAAQALLTPDEAMLVYFAGRNVTWLWVLRADRAGMHMIRIGGKELAAEVTALRDRLAPDRNPSLRPFDATRAYDLHQKILAPATRLLEGARHVFVVPDGALESLPMGVLVTQLPKADPDTPADHRDVAWFAKKYAVTVLPSVGSLRALRQFAANARAASPFVGIGNPALEGKPGTARGIRLAGLFRGTLADVAAVRQLEPLPETEEELRAVARSLAANDNDLYLGKRATETMLRAGDLSRYRVVHFATHGLMSGDLQGLAEPALVLTPPPEATPDDDGLLTASEVATLKLNADWVVLSACNTAAADGTPDAGGLSGLAKAFFYAGARSLLVSHWSVPSTATVKLVTGAFEELKKDPGIGRAEALRRAQMAMMDPNQPPEFSHPLAWAPFVLAGEGGAGR